MCILLKINTSIKPITTEASNRQTDKQTDEPTDIILQSHLLMLSEEANKKLAGDKFFISFL